MIFTLILTIAYNLLSWIVSFFPISTGFPTIVHDAMAGLGGYLGILSPLVPIDTMITCVGIVLSVELSIFAFKSVKWIVSHIPWIGGKGN